MRFLWRLTKWGLLALFLAVLALAAPVAYVATACKGTPGKQDYRPIITEAEFQRQEANSFLTYPEWHIVYAYEGLARALETGDEHVFGYFSSIKGFWSAACALNKVAAAHGGADKATVRTNYVIGASFTLEMGMKALYEETVGRLAAWQRGPVKSPQDVIAAEMAADYAAFLQQTPWYKYPFEQEVANLWNAPLTLPLRGWERRLALGGEWKAKAAYARVIANAVAATGAAKLEIRSAVSGLSEAQLAAIKDVQVIGPVPQGFIINTPRYQAFTNVLEQIAKSGGAMVEIAGNDDVLVTVTMADGEDASVLPVTKVLAVINRDGFGGKRALLNVRVSELGALINQLANGSMRLEHVYDY
jgi:hypothetical protein